MSECTGLPASIRSMGWIVYQSYKGAWKSYNPLTQGRDVTGYDTLQELVESLQKSCSTPGLHMGTIGAVDIQEERFLDWIVK